VVVLGDGVSLDADPLHLVLEPVGHQHDVPLQPVDLPGQLFLLFPLLGQQPHQLLDLRLSYATTQNHTHSLGKLQSCIHSLKARRAATDLYGVAILVELVQVLLEALRLSVAFSARTHTRARAHTRVGEGAEGEPGTRWTDAPSPRS
jgi:hypothetical protein